MEILGLKQSGIAEDGRHIVLTFEVDTGTQDVEVNASLLDALLSQLSATLEKAREKQGGQYSPLFAEPDAYIVKASPVRQAITMGFRMSNGLNHSLIFSAPDATRLHTRIGEELEKLKPA